MPARTTTATRQFTLESCRVRKFGTKRVLAVVGAAKIHCRTNREQQGCAGGFGDGENPFPCESPPSSFPVENSGTALCESFGAQGTLCQSSTHTISSPVPIL